MFFTITESNFTLPALDGDVNRLSKLLSKTDVDALDSSGYSSLHYASRAGHLEVVKLLVARGANVNLLTRNNRSSSLHRASQMGKIAVVTYLLQNGANSDLQDSDGCTALHRAAIANHTNICKLLISHNHLLLHIPDSRNRLPKDCCSDLTLQTLLDV